MLFIFFLICQNYLLASVATTSQQPIPVDVSTLSMDKLIFYTIAASEAYKLTKTESFGPNNLYSTYYLEGLDEIVDRSKNTSIRPHHKMSESVKKWLIYETIGIWGDYARFQHGNMPIWHKYRRLNSVKATADLSYDFSIGQMMIDLDKKFKRITDTSKILEYFKSLEKIPNCGFCESIKEDIKYRVQNQSQYIPDFPDKPDMKTALTQGINKFNKNTSIHYDGKKLAGYYLYVQFLRYLTLDEKAETAEHLELMQRVIVPMTYLADKYNLYKKFNKKSSSSSSASVVVMKRISIGFIISKLILATGNVVDARKMLEKFRDRFKFTDQEKNIIQSGENIIKDYFNWSQETSVLEIITLGIMNHPHSVMCTASAELIREQFDFFCPGVNMLRVKLREMCDELTSTDLE
jgi:glutaredoxin-related protein